MDEHYDHNQTLVPESFLTLHARHGRALLPRAEIEARHELCEDLALHTAAFLAARHHEGDDTNEALLRCRDGLRAGAAAIAPAEMTWVLRRVAELQEWPEPAWLTSADGGDARTASRIATSGGDDGQTNGNGNANAAGDAAADANPGAHASTDSHDRSARA